jgi:nitrate reductase beta subunit
MRIPITYLANLLTAGDEGPVRLALKRLSAVRRFMRTKRVENRIDETIFDGVGLSRGAIEAMYAHLALARIDQRFVLPTASRGSGDLWAKQGCCGFGSAMGRGCHDQH